MAKGGSVDPSSGFSQTGDAKADAVSNRSGGGYSDKDATTETKSGARDTSRAWHQARDDADARKK